MQKTLEMSKTATDEEWRPQFDAIQNLRVMNKFHFTVLEKNIDQYAEFIK